MSFEEPEIIINGIKISPLHSETLRVAIQVLASEIELSLYIPISETDKKNYELYNSRTNEILKIMKVIE